MLNNNNTDLISSQLFEDIMNILDPEMNLIDEEEGSLAEEEEDGDKESLNSEGQQSSRDEDAKTDTRE